VEAKVVNGYHGVTNNDCSQWTLNYPKADSRRQEKIWRL